MSNVYILLFRGINVGGNKIVKMETLRQVLGEAGFGDVATYIQSGNVVLDLRQGRGRRRRGRDEGLRPDVRLLVAADDPVCEGLAACHRRQPVRGRHGGRQPAARGVPRRRTEGRGAEGARGLAKTEHWPRKTASCTCTRRTVSAPPRWRRRWTSCSRCRGRRATGTRCSSCRRWRRARRSEHCNGRPLREAAGFQPAESLVPQGQALDV